MAYTSAKQTMPGTKVFQSINTSDDELPMTKSPQRNGSVESLNEMHSQFESVVSSQVNLFKDDRKSVKTSLVEQIKKKDSLKRLNNKNRNSQE